MCGRRIEGHRWEWSIRASIATSFQILKSHHRRRFRLIGSPFLAFQVPAKRPLLVQGPKAVTVALAGIYSSGYEQRSEGSNEIFVKRALYSVNGNANNVMTFTTGRSLLLAAKKLSNDVGTIGQLMILGHSFPVGFISYDSSPDQARPWTGFYIDDPRNLIFPAFAYAPGPMKLRVQENSPILFLAGTLTSLEAVKLSSLAVTPMQSLVIFRLY